MKIALFGPTYPFRGGISHFNTCLYKNLAKKHAVKIFSYCYQYPSFIYPGENAVETDDTFKIENADYKMHSLKPWTWVKTAEKMASFGQDICLFPWWSIFWFPHYRLMLPLIKYFNKNTKIILFCHNIIEHEPAKWKIKLTLNLFNNVDGFICHSKQNTEYLRGIFPKTKIFFTPHPTYEQFGATQLSKKESKEILKLPENSKAMLFFGYIRKYKGLDLLLEIMPELVKKIPELHLVIAGEFWNNRCDYEKLITSAIKNRVHIFDKYIDNTQIPIYFKAADLSVLPYRSSTGSGIAQLSLAQGVPLIGTKTGSLAEVIEPDINGYVVPPNNTAALFESIINYFSHPNPQQFIDGVRETSKKYSWDRAEETIVNLYNSL